MSIPSLYVSPAGHDAWSGLLPEPGADRTDGPFRTLQRAAAVLQPGQTCYLRAGTYRETLRPARDGEPGRPLVFRNFPGETATLSATDPLDGWTRLDDRVYQTPMPWDLADQNQVFAGETMLDEARWPHRSGSLLDPGRAQAAAGTPASLSDPNLPGPDGAWVGATLWCAGGDQWLCWSEAVTGYDAASHTLSFQMANPKGWYTVRPGSPYVLMGWRGALAAPGEWWYDRDHQRLLLIPPSGSAGPGAIEAKRRQHCFDLAGRAHVDLIGLRFHAGGCWTDAATHHVRLLACRGQYVAHSYQREVGDEAGVFLRGHDNELRDSELAWSATSLLRVEGRDHRIVNCYLHDGDYGGKWRGAVALSGRRILFSHNTVCRSGRDAVSIHGLMESLIQYNDLAEAGWLTRDLGLTYGHNSDFMNTQIRYNRVHDNRAGHCAMGIYFDHCSHNAIVHHNVIWNTPFDPIQINNPSHFCLVFRNTCHGPGTIHTFDHSQRDDLFGLRLAHNLFARPPKLPAHVVQEGNVIAEDPGYDDPAHGRFTLRPGSPEAGAYAPGESPWRTGHDFARPPSPDPVWEAADLDWMNTLANACFELGTLEGWTPSPPGAASLVPGNGWGNMESGGKGNAPTGTSRFELRLGPGPAAIAQTVAGLHPDTPHCYSGWLRAEPGSRVRLGLRHPDGREAWSVPVAGDWERVGLDFRTAPGQTAVTVLIAKDDGPGHAWADNLGLPRAVGG